MSDTSAPSRRSVDALIVLLGALAFALYSVYLGKDANYDLRNYHYYGCACLLDGRVGWDLYAAQYGSFLNPVPYLPFCWAVNHLPPMLAGALFGAVAGLAFGLLYLLAKRVLDTTAPAPMLALLAALIGVWSPLWLSTVGTSFTDAWTPLLVLGGLYLVLGSPAAPTPRTVFVAGLALGCATGFKLVNGVYALALFLAIAWTWFRAKPYKSLAAYLAGAGLGTLTFGGAWAWMMQREYLSPLFPFYNNVFRSPYFAIESFNDGRWKATRLSQIVTNPLHWAAERSSLSSELAFRDARFALIVLLFVPALAYALFAKRERGAATLSARARTLVLVFFAFAYLLWLFTFGHQRYATPLELLCGLALLALLDCLPLSRKALVYSCAGIGLFSMLWMRAPDWGHKPWGRTWFETTVPAALKTPSTLYLITDSSVVGYVVPLLPRDARFVRIESNDRPLPPNRYLGPRARAIVDRHSGPIRVLFGERSNDTALAGFGVAVDHNDCLKLHTYADEFLVCAAYRVAQGPRSAVQLVHRAELARLTLPSTLRLADAPGVDGWSFQGPALPGPPSARARARADNHVMLQLTPPPNATQISGQIRLIADRDHAATIVDLVWMRGDKELGRAAPSTKDNTAGKEFSIPILMERPAGADTLLVGFRPWRDIDGTTTFVSGELIWWARQDN